MENYFLAERRDKTKTMEVKLKILKHILDNNYQPGQTVKGWQDLLNEFTTFASLRTVRKASKELQADGVVVLLTNAVNVADDIQIVISSIERIAIEKLILSVEDCAYFNVLKSEVYKVVDDVYNNALEGRLNE